MPKAYFVDRREAARDDSDEDNEYEEINYEGTFQKDMVLFCIDAGPSMHRTNAEGTTHLYTALKAASSMMEKKLISSPHDHVGIMLFNCKDTDFTSVKAGEYYRGSCEMQPIRQVNVRDTYMVKAALKSAQHEPAHLESEYPPAEKQMRIDWALANAGVLMVAAANAGSKRVFFITDNDDPHPLGADFKSAKARRASLDKMVEFRKIGVSVEPFFISSSDTTPFQINRFYADIFTQYDDDEDTDVPGLRIPTGFRTSSTEQLRGQELKRNVWDSTVRFQELEEDITTRETPRRVIFNVRFELAAMDPGENDPNRLPQARRMGSRWQIGVKGYNLVSRTMKGNPVKVILDEDDAELKEVVTHQHYVDANSGRPLQKAEVLSAFQFGALPHLRAQVTLTETELQKIRSFGMLPCLKLLGFRDKNFVRFDWNVKHAYFIYPSDAEWKGSKRTFSALLASMLSKGKVGLGLFMPRQNTIPVFVAIVPQKEEVQDGQQVTPPGMHLITIPFVDDIRNIPSNLQHDENATPEQIDAAASIIERYQKRPLNPDHYPNPALNHHHAVLMATAFQEPLPETVEDLVVPDYRSIRKRTANLIDAWHSSIDDDSRLSGLVPSAAMDHTETSINVRKEVMENDHEIVALWEQGRLVKLTVEQLKSACTWYRLDKKGLKADLVARVDQHLTRTRGSS